MSQNQTRRSRRHKSRKGAPSHPAKSREKPLSAAKRATGLWLYGTHAVHAALSNPDRNVLQILGTAEALNGIRPELAKKLGDKRQTVDRTEIDALLGEDKVHQGIALNVAPLPDLDVSDVIGTPDETDAALLVALDQVTDPHNVGAVLRSAAAFGARALLTTRHNAPDETGVLAKAASGALETVPIIRATNLKRAFKTCQDHGFWSVGLDGTAETNLDHLETPKRCIMVLGAEGKGLRQGTREVCDFTARLPMTGAMESLNVSNAAAVSMYEWQRQQQET